MSPPGKKVGVTVCESVANAIRPPGLATIAASVSSRNGSLENTATNSSSISSRLSLPPEPCASRTVSYRDVALDRSAVVADPSGGFDMERLLVHAVDVPGAAGALVADHARAVGGVGRAQLAEHSALVGPDLAQRHLGAAAALRMLGAGQLGLVQATCEAQRGAVRPVRLAQLVARRGDLGDATPADGGQLEHLVELLLGA